MFENIQVFEKRYEELNQNSATRPFWRTQLSMRS